MIVTNDDVVKYIEDFLLGRDGPEDWDYFISVRIDDPKLDAIRVQCVQLPDSNPPVAGGYCSSAEQSGHSPTSTPRLWAYLNCIP